ncbi:MAG: hypothetical protein Q4E77_08395, partial [Conchiformibius sp.]|nr:hypothetical protein [Conchiformibius sp.]
MKTATVSTKLKQAQEAYEAGDFAVAHALFLQAAKQKSTVAQYRLGNLYAEGQGVNKNPIQAADWYRQAAERGYPPAQAKLAEMYANGVGVPLDYRQAADWFKLAAEQKDKTPENRLAEAHEAYARKDYDFALSYFQELAQDEYEEAQFYLGEMYGAGRGTEQDHAQSAEWYRLAAEQGHLPAQVRLGKMYANGLGVVQDYREAAVWLEKAAAQEENHSDRLFDKAHTAYEQKDYAAALQGFQTLAARGHDAAQYYLGSMYTHGYGVTADADYAAECYFQAAAQGHASALTMLRRSVEEGHAAAEYYLGELYGRALGVAQDEVLAADYYLKAAAQGHAAAQAKMGELYAFGRGVPQDYARAARWYAEAAESGQRTWEDAVWENETSAAEADESTEVPAAPETETAAPVIEPVKETEPEQPPQVSETVESLPKAKPYQTVAEVLAMMQAREAAVLLDESEEEPQFETVAPSVTEKPSAKQPETKQVQQTVATPIKKAAETVEAEVVPPAKQPETKQVQQTVSTPIKKEAE